MNNSVFGKTMENIRNRVNIKLVTDKKKAERLAAKPNFKHCNIFNENLIAIHMKKTILTFDKPVYLGMHILELSKTLMFGFHYNYIKKKYGNKAKLLLAPLAEGQRAIVMALCPSCVRPSVRACVRKLFL